MMFIPPFCTKRIRAEMKELTLGQAIELCEIPEGLNELGISRALGAVVAETSLPLGEWTVQERLAAVCHYLTARHGGDWEVSDGIMLSRYLLDKDYPDKPYSIDDELEIVPLTGGYAEACERATVGQNAGARLLAVMAASIRNKGGEEAFDGTPDEFVQENISRLKALPQSAFDDLYRHFQTAFSVDLKHIFEMVVTDDGLAVLPQTDGESEDGINAVMFPVDTFIGSAVAALWRRDA